MKMQTLMMLLLLCIFLMVPPFTQAQNPALYSQLDPRPYDPSVDANINLYIGNWRESVPRVTHGTLIERDILTQGDPQNPTARGTVLSFVNRFTYATLSSHGVTTPTTLDGEQEIFYVISGTGLIYTGEKITELSGGIAILIPPGIEFSISNTASESLTMFVISEPCTPGFRPNSEILVANEHTTPYKQPMSHWVSLSKILFSTQSGLAVLENVVIVELHPMTFFHPHSHPEGCEEVWTAMTDNCYFLLGKEIRYQPSGTAYMIPPNGKTPHANFNVSDVTCKLFYFARYSDHKLRP
ncbi:cupin domain-containing protein [Candidatus Latescibacterota bacterium]